MKEAEIRPQALFDRYLELSRKDIETFFVDQRGFVDVACPACRSERLSEAFRKLGFTYATCDACGTLFLTPRPTNEMQLLYARESKAVEFWSTHFYRETAEARRVKMFRPRAEMVRSLIERNIALPSVFADVGSGYGIFLEEIKRLGCFETIVGIEPAPALANVCREKGFTVIEEMVEDVDRERLQCDLVTAFEVLEHVFDPETFLRACGRIVGPAGLLVFTTLTISGFDLQVLWSESKSIYPPHHINLISVEGMRRLVERSGFDVVELSTPGKLDLDIVAGALRENPTLPIPRFVHSLVAQPQIVLDEFQAFLQTSLLSSHIRVVARRPL
jgi:2-polyprenyl-3-methyl-5-hydroxy-6-metoxy-1,4-benzoquinol methylase